MQSKSEEEIKEYMASKYPEEGVAVITSYGVSFVDNISDEKTKSFRISDSDYAKLENENIISIIHSHPDWYPCPSESDMKNQELTGVKWGICSTNEKGSTNIFYFGGDKERAPLIGRSFMHGVTDCYELIRDYYDLKLNIKLPNFYRDWDWWNKGKTLYEDGFSKAGFKGVQLSELKEHDVLLMNLHSKTPNHGAVYVGNNLILHHLSGRKPIDLSRISKREPINRWRDYISHVLRHESL